MTTDFQTVVDRVEQGNLSLDEISSFRGFCAVWLYRYYEQRGQMKAESAMWQTANREKYKSQAECERAWDATDAGQELIKISHTLNGLEKINDFLTSLYFQTNKEMQLAQRDS